jgi:hypothetical protein
MRAEALDVWFVPQIFSALPVLLQGALALFLAGMIDFVLPLGSKLTIPVCVIIGLTLLFLAATMVLPTCQAFLFLTGFYPYSKPPTPCAFKSPQSRVLLSIFSPFICALSFVIFWVYRHLHSHPSMFRRHTALPYLQDVLQQSTWPSLDQAWLRLRDAYHQCILFNDTYHLQDWSQIDHFPIGDITQYLVKSVVETPTIKDMETFLGAAVYSFQEISDSRWKIPRNGHREEKVHYNNYFEQLLQLGMPSCSVPIFNFCSYEPSGNKELTAIWKTYNQEQMLYFLLLICVHDLSLQLSQYQLELWSHIISQELPLPSGSHSLIPTLLENDTLEHIWYGHPLCKHFYWRTIENLILILNGVGSQRFAAGADMLSVVFKSAAGHRISQDQSLHSLCTHSQMPQVLLHLARMTVVYLVRVKEEHISDTHWQRLQEIDAQYISTFEFMANHLSNEISDSEWKSDEDTPSVLFYLASIFMWKLLVWEKIFHELITKDGSFGQGLVSVLEALLQYRTRTSGQKNNLLETRFASQDYSSQKRRWIVRFSEEWWDSLFKIGRDIGLEAAEQGTHVLPVFIQ